MHSIPTVEVDTCIELRLLVPERPALPLPVSWRYRSGDPYAVTVCFHGADEQVEWVFARELLAAGLDGAAGFGDVEVRAVRDGGADVVMISLASPDGRAELEADAVELRSFLDRTRQVVPLGGEHRYVDVDAELEQLLAG